MLECVDNSVHINICFFFIQLNQERMSEKGIFWLCEKKDYYYGNMFRIPYYLIPKTFYMRNFYSFFSPEKICLWKSCRKYRFYILLFNNDRELNISELNFVCF